MELRPQPLSHLLRRVLVEPGRQGTVFDLPTNKFWRGGPAELDLSRSFHGAKAATVVGPAAGPHTQLAQNIGLSYLAGARILELKTVQILDELKIPRPCIDATNIGFNVEWSQELKIEESTVEYPKAALLLAALRKLGHPETSATETVFDLSLGYDLAGIRSERVTNFVRTMLDCRPVVARLLEQLPSDLVAFRDLTVPSRLIDCVTLSTFHGCPAHEIELIARYLLEEIGVHVVVKLNPTLLGYEAVSGILRDQLGYQQLELDRPSFEHDLKWNDALAMIGRLRSVAHQRHLAFGVKLTNTLVVKNHKTFFPASEKLMYLSGQPLHVLSTQLLARLRAALPLLGPNGEPPVMYSFSAGIDQHNFPAAAAADLCPVTTCTDLLRPGGYARLPKYLDNLVNQMRAVGAVNIPQFVLLAHGAAQDAAVAIHDALAKGLKQRGIEVPEDLRARLSKVVPTSDPVASFATVLVPEPELAAALWVHQAGSQNSQYLAKTALEDPRYAAEKNAKVPKKVGSTLALFDCVSCDKCVPVCPNDANFTYSVAPLQQSTPRWTWHDGQVTEQSGTAVSIQASQQWATFVDFCNGCGNCDIFCPEDGGPYVLKPHWFANAATFAAEPHLDGFYLESPTVLVGRHRGALIRYEKNSDGTVRYSDAEVQLTAVLRPEVRLISHDRRTEAGHFDAGQLLVLNTLLEGVLSSVNPVSAPFLR